MNIQEPSCQESTTDISDWLLICFVYSQNNLLLQAYKVNLQLLNFSLPLWCWCNQYRAGEICLLLWLLLLPLAMIRWYLLRKKIHYRGKKNDITRTRIPGDSASRRYKFSATLMSFSISMSMRAPVQIKHLDVSPLVPAVLRLA